jgi:hypothetical protein
MLALDITHPRVVALLTYNLRLEVKRIPCELSVFSGGMVKRSTFDLARK